MCIDRCHNPRSRRGGSGRASSTSSAGERVVHSYSNWPDIQGVPWARTRRMPKLIDYSLRFELIREAVVRIAARDGGRAVNLATIATEMQVSQSTLRRMLRSTDVLAETGVVWLARNRQRQRFLHKRPKTIQPGSLAHVKWVMWKELPLDAEEVEWARAWAELVATGAGVRITELRADHERWLDSLVAEAVAMLAVPVARSGLARVHLRALIDGLTAAVCAGRITPEQLQACLDVHLREISCSSDAVPISSDGA